MFTPFCHFLAAGYPAAQSSTQGYSQSTQSYGASGYDTAPSAATPAASQSYGNQSAYTAQTSYPGYGQQAAPTAPQAYVSNYWCCINFSCWVLAARVHGKMAKGPVKLPGISCSGKLSNCLHLLGLGL